MKKVCVFSSVHNWDDTRIYNKQCHSLAKIYDVTYLAPAKESKVFTNSFRLVNLPIWKTMSDRKKIRTCLFRKLKTIDAEIFHFHDPELIFIGLYLKYFKKKKIIYDIHEDVAKQILDKDYIPSKLLRKMISLAYWILEQFVIRLMDAVIVAGEDILSNYKPRVVINNFPIIRPPTSVKKDNTIVYIGNLNVIYGINQMVAAVKILNEKLGQNVCLKLIGKFEDVKLKTRILEEYNKYIKYLGWMKQEEVYYEVSKSLVGIVNYLPIPNHYNLRSNKVFEYMECSLPVIYPNFPDWENKIGNYDVGISVDPLNVDQIAGALNTLLEAHEKRKKMAKNSRTTVEKFFNWKTEEVKLLTIYYKLLGE